MPYKDVRFTNVTTVVYGGQDWANASGAEGDDSNPATSTTTVAYSCWDTKLNSGQYTNADELTYYLEATNTDFKIPLKGYNITTLELRLKCLGDPSVACGPILICNAPTQSYDTDPAVTDSVIQLIKGGAISGTNKASYTWSSTYTTQTYDGSATGYWGLSSFSISDLNASDFGIAIAANLIYGKGYSKNNSGCESAWLKGVRAQVDDIVLRIHYTSSIRRARSAWR